MADPVKLLPVALPAWPACERCLSWSEDDLAVATGETVHILTPKTSLHFEGMAGHPQWNIHNLRVNIFQQDEWPEQVLAATEHFSIGEEQSSSHVVALAWSSPGIGVHRRSVLGVLTSNLILSIWETDGRHGQFKRACLVNAYLKSSLPANGINTGRREVRIRAFTWLPPVNSTTEPKWGLHHLIVADDNRTITILRVCRTKGSSSNRWHLEFVQSFQQSDWNPAPGNIEGISPLQQKLRERAPILQLRVGSWQEEQDSLVGDYGDAIVSQLTIDCNAISTRVQLYATDIFANTLPYFEIRQNDDNNDFTPDSDVYTLMSHDSDLQQTYFKDALHSICDDFDSLYQLAGHHRIRFWGVTQSVNGTKAVACVTLHPSDMIEYTIPSAERCSLVFKDTGAVSAHAQRDLVPAFSVQQRILELACAILEDTTLVRSALDRKILLTYCRLESMMLDPQVTAGTGINAIKETILTQHNHHKSVSGSDVHGNGRRGQEARQVSDAPESCEICGASIPFTSIDSEATCASGHHFTRCQLSFVAIQEPGISKYCSKCGKQFLDLVKLGASGDPCFAEAIFDEFDVCPYCQAKFQG